MNKTTSYMDIPVDAFSVGMTDNSVRLFLGLEDVPGLADSIAFSCGAYMTHRSLKTLAILLTAVVENYEEAQGEILLDPEKVNQIKAGIQNARSGVIPPTA